MFPPLSPTMAPSGSSITSMRPARVARSRAKLNSRTQSSMADKPPTNRSQYYKQVLLKPGWLAYLTAWSVISNSDTISEKIIKPNISTETWKKMESYLLTTAWHWYVWAIGALLIVLVGAIQSGYRLYKAAQD